MDCFRLSLFFVTAFSERYTIVDIILQFLTVLSIAVFVVWVFEGVFRN